MIRGFDAGSFGRALAAVGALVVPLLTAVAALACGAAGGVGSEPRMQNAAAGAPGIRCELALEQSALGGPVRVRMTLGNDGSEDVHALTWNTPFEEAWFGTPFVVTRDGEELTYGGAMVKRGNPEAGSYVTIAAGDEVSVVADLAEVYPFDEPGAYEVRVVGSLHDLATSGVQPPRPLAEHRAVSLDCAPLRFELARR